LAYVYRYTGIREKLVKKILASPHFLSMPMNNISTNEGSALVSCIINLVNTIVGAGMLGYVLFMTYLEKTSG